MDRENTRPFVVVSSNFLTRGRATPLFSKEEFFCFEIPWDNRRMQSDFHFALLLKLSTSYSV